MLRSQRIKRTIIKIIFTLMKNDKYFGKQLAESIWVTWLLEIIFNIWDQKLGNKSWIWLWHLKSRIPPHLRNLIMIHTGLHLVYGADYFIFKHYHFHIFASGGKPNGYHHCMKNPNTVLQSPMRRKISKLFLRIIWKKEEESFSLTK